MICGFQTGFCGNASQLGNSGFFPTPFSKEKYQRPVQKSSIPKNSLQVGTSRTSQELQEPPHVWYYLVAWSFVVRFITDYQLVLRTLRLKPCRSARRARQECSVHLTFTARPPIVRPRGYATARIMRHVLCFCSVFGVYMLMLCTRGLRPSASWLILTGSST